MSGEALGLHLNLGKCELWWPGVCAEPLRFPECPAEIVRVVEEGIHLLGAPIGSLAHTTPAFTEILCRLETLDSDLAALKDKQIQFCLLRGCLSLNKVNHLPHACPPMLTAEGAAHFDDRCTPYLRTQSQPLSSLAARPGCRRPCL